MTLVLDIGSLTLARGAGSNGPVSLTNSGPEDISNIFFRVNDTVVFRALNALTYGFGWRNCLNTYSNILAFVGHTHALPANTTYQMSLMWVVKNDAQIEDNNIECECRWIAVK